MTLEDIWEGNTPSRASSHAFSCYLYLEGQISRGKVYVTLMGNSQWSGQMMKGSKFEKQMTRRTEGGHGWNYQRRDTRHENICIHVNVHKKAFP